MRTLLVWYGCNAYHVHYILPDALTLTHLLFRAGPFFAFAIFFDIRALDLFLAASTIGGGGEPNTPAPCETNNDENNGGRRMALGVYDPNAGPNQPMGALGGG